RVDRDRGRGHRAELIDLLGDVGARVSDVGQRRLLLGLPAARAEPEEYGADGRDGDGGPDAWCPDHGRDAANARAGGPHPVRMKPPAPLAPRGAAPRVA